MSMYANSLEFVKKDLNMFGFDVLKEVGRGGFGTVFEVRRRCCAKRRPSVAVKRVKRSDVKSVRNERSVYQRMEHSPYIPELYFERSTDVYTYFFFELIRGETLFTHLHKNDSCLYEGDVKPILREMAIGIDEMHKSKIIHRDIKLKNILLDEYEAAYIVDFGSARVFNENEIEEAEGLAGTVTHISPEMLRGKYSYETDWWSFGVCAYQMLTGEEPFSYDEDSDSDIKERILTEDPYCLKLDSLSRNAPDFLRRLLCKNPRKRLGASGAKEVLNHPFLAW